ncbi:arginine--tRNA ligase [Haladaptatus sp. F3-133]|uniref:Arginine--tRNA ligase n=1 Tax=Halorutilus salinus TaxID=2487751 RepID=A0A9Q4GGW1_9EURY|nr:arginine--tRNA ligase [Halorutilus salinus]MCX2818165.1 arginine--tRNA ligase [Halorutilus salinus]
MLTELRRQVGDALAEALDEAGYDADPDLEDPPEGVDADIASPVAFKLSGDPTAIADELASAVSLDDRPLIGWVGTQGPYLNFRASELYFERVLGSATDDGYPTLPEKDETIVLEHTSANPTGPLHIGRARNPVIGDSLARVMRAAGYDVTVEYYVNDMGRQVATITWALDEFDEDDVADLDGRDKGDHDVVRYYRRANEVLEGEEGEEYAERAEREIDELLQALEDGEEGALEHVGETVDRCLEGQLESLERLGASYDGFVRESGYVLDGTVDGVASRLKADSRSYEEDDAYALDLTDWGIDKELVFVRADGTSLYTTRDIAYHIDKFERSDRAVDVLGEDHKLQARQLAAALDALGYDRDPESVFYSFVSLPEGQMSTREGNVVNLDDLLDEAVDRARAEIEKRADDRDRDVDEVEETARAVGIGAVRYDIVARQPQKSITFRWDEALNFDGQHAPYVQYVGARASGIGQKTDAKPADPSDAVAELEAPEERALIRKIGELSAVVEDSADELAPHRLATYSRELAERFNEFYRDCPVMNADEDTKRARLALVTASRVAIERSLGLIGVETPEAM